ncbi:hypothetical protein HOP52_00970 [Halomonas campisalis]|uniref:Uncharacterized protein n=1 Tax=Billgrantia campisalis TaxID=74661 RepID=A0ABS9P3J3_9GAMM|nr:hypothetical protein [Halomonas campisalis]MCG6656350.1 hypothetical protein [Halomonas campisalis]MDR5861534.1 hypothetical protein [Halomonas campisalis]
MSLVEKVNNFLTLGGIQIHRVPTMKDLGKNVPSTAGKLVELIGPSGVGKTHLYRTLFPKIKRDWHSRSGARAYSKRQGSFTQCNVDNNPIVEVLLKWKSGNIWCRDIPLWRKVRLYDFFVQEMAADVIAKEKLLASCGMFSDEGVTHNFTRELLQWYEMRHEDNVDALSSFLHRRLIILVDAPEDYIMSNLKRRNSEKSSGAQNDWLSYMSEREAFEMISRSKQIKKRWIAVVTSLGVPTLTLEASDGLVANEQRVFDFLGAQGEQAI